MGLYDDSLLDIATKRFQQLSKRQGDFALFVSTIDTHPPGRVTKKCVEKIDLRDDRMLDTVEAVKELASDPSDHPLMRGPDVVIACARQGNVLNQALEMAKLGTHIVLAGFVPPTTIDPGILLHKQLVLSGIMAGRYGQNRINGRISLHVLAQEQLDPTPLLSGSMPFSDIENAIGLTYAGEKLAVLLEP